MKNLLLFIALGVSLSTFSQTDLITETMNNTVFVTCDSTGTPILKNGKAFYFIFDESGRIDVRAGAEISEAIESPVLYTGTWANKDTKIFWEWTESQKTGSATFDPESNNLTTSAGMVYLFLGKY